MFSKLLHKQGRWLVLAVPYVWLLLFFLVPFLIVFKISLSSPELAMPPYSDMFLHEGSTVQIVLNFDNLRNLAQAESLERALLVYRITDLTLNLLNLNCCHNLFLLYPLNTFSMLIPRVPATV